MDKQAIFNRAVHGLAAQGWKQSMEVGQDGNAYCKYRSDTGLKCGIGQLFPDSLYSMEMEGSGVCSPSLIFRHVFEYLNAEFSYNEDDSESNLRETKDSTWLSLLQYAHDRSQSATPEAMKKAFVKFAEEENLKFPEVLK